MPVNYTTPAAEALHPVAGIALGVAEAGFFPGIILYLTYWYPAQRRGRIIAMFMTGIQRCSSVTLCWASA